MTELTEIHVSQIQPGTAYELVGTNSAATQDVYLTLVAGTNISITPSGNNLTISATGSGGADTSLDNLSMVAINTSLLPASNASIDLGSSSLDFRSSYVELLQIAQIQTVNQTISLGFNSSVPISHAIAVGKTLYISLGSFFQIT